MTILYKIEPTLNLVYYAGFGLCTSGEFLDVEKTASKDPLRNTEMKIIIDVRYAELDIDIEDLRTLVALNRKLIKDGHQPEMTAVVSFNKYMNVLEETYHLLADGLSVKINIFNQIKDALVWLGLSNEEAQIEQIGRSLLQGRK